jgi:hypothetical protein
MTIKYNEGSDADMVIFVSEECPAKCRARYASDIHGTYGEVSILPSAQGL